MLRTVTEMQNDVGMMSQIVYFRIISLFGNNFTKICYKFDENTFFSKKIGLKHYKNNHFSCLVFSAAVAMATVYKFEIWYWFIKQTQSFVSDINTCYQYISAINIL